MKNEQQLKLLNDDQIEEIEQKMKEYKDAGLNETKRLHLKHNLIMQKLEDNNEKI